MKVCTPAFHAELMAAVSRVKRTDTEVIRATRAGDGDRLNKAGTDFRVAMNKLYAVAGKSR